MKPVLRLFSLLFMVVLLHDSTVGQNIKVIGIYSHWVTSMCSQNCTNINVGDYEITSPLQNLPEWTTDRCAYIEGEFVKVKELPTIAGPRANTKNADKEIEVRKIKVNKSKEVRFPELNIEKSEIEKHNNNEDFTVQMTFDNPVDTELKIKIIVNNQEEKVTLPPKSSETVDFKISHTDMYYINLKIVNNFYSVDKANESLEKAEKQGMVVYVSKTFRVETLIND